MRLRDKHRCVRALSRQQFCLQACLLLGQLLARCTAMLQLPVCWLVQHLNTLPPCPALPCRPLAAPCPAGDGAGILVAMPHIFLSHVVQAECGFELPPQGDYAVGQAFLPTDPEQYEAAKAAIAKVCGNQGHTLLGWRRVPTDNATLGESAVKTEPLVEQFFVLRATTEDMQQLSLERQVRRRGQEAGAGGSLWVWVWGTF